MALLPTLNIVSWEGDPLKIIDHRLSHYAISYSMDTTYMKSGLMSLRRDISLYADDEIKFKDAVSRSIRTLLKEYFSDIEVTVSTSDEDKDGRYNVTITIRARDSKGSYVDATNIFSIEESRIVKLN